MWDIKSMEWIWIHGMVMKSYTHGWHGITWDGMGWLAWDEQEFFVIWLYSTTTVYLSRDNWGKVGNGGILTKNLDLGLDWCECGSLCPFVLYVDRYFLMTRKKQENSRPRSQCNAIQICIKKWEATRKRRRFSGKGVKSGFLFGGVERILFSPLPLKGGMVSI